MQDIVVVLLYPIAAAWKIRMNAFDSDILIVGAGIGGASLASSLVSLPVSSLAERRDIERRDIMLVESESQPGYHATGRSAAFWHESYGGPMVQPLTRASQSLLSSPPRHFSEQGFLRSRKAVTLGRTSEASQVENFIATYRKIGMSVERIGRRDLVRMIPGLRSQWDVGAYEAGCSDIDVAGLHMAFLRQARRHGVRLALRTKFRKASWERGGWQVETSSGILRVRTIVDAAGAWADHVATCCSVRPLGIRSFRRTIVQLRLERPTPASLPLVIHINGDFYFKGEGEGRIWLSPHDETASLACDASPEEWDVALAIDRLQRVVNWPIAVVERSWAGLRSFAPDRLPVFGRDPLNPEFVWCAGQGGFGIQTSPAIGALLAAELAQTPQQSVDKQFAHIDAALYSPARFG